MILIPEKAKNIMLRLQLAGAKDVLIVGGFVRDALLGAGLGPSRNEMDIDIEVYGLNYDQIIAALQNDYNLDLVGRAFGTLKVDGNIDISLPRRENKVGVGHKEFRIHLEPNITFREAASRRDFTINAMAVGLDGLVRDPYCGQIDLKKKILRRVSWSFSEDPLRILRAMQFAARFDMAISEETADQGREMSLEFSSLPKERIWEEWKKWALKGKTPALGIGILVVTNWLRHFPEIRNMQNVPQDSTYHPEGCVFTHTMHVINEASRIAIREHLEEHDKLVLLFASLCHDFGKAETTKLMDNRWTAHGHCEASVALAESFLRRIGALESVIEQVKPLVAEHLIHAGASPTPRIIRRLANRLAPASIRLLSLLIEADINGRPPLKCEVSPFKEFELTAANLNLSSDKPKPILMGRHLLEMGIQAGPRMGKILKAAFEAELDGIITNINNAREWVRVYEKEY